MLNEEPSIVKFPGARSQFMNDENDDGIYSVTPKQIQVISISL